MSYGDASDPQRDSFYDIHEWNLDKSVKPHVMVRGFMGKDTGGTWRYLRVSASGAISNDDAANFRMSAVGVTVTTSPLSADSSSISAKQGDAANLMMSAKSSDAGTFRVSAVGGTAGDNVLVDGTDQSLSATVQRVSGVVSAGANVLAVYAQNRDDAVNLRISALSKDGATFRVSAVNNLSANQSVSALGLEGTAFIGQVSASLKAGTANIGYVSAVLDNGSVSAKSSDANQLHVSSIQGDAGLLRVSAVGGTAGDNTLVDGETQTVSANLIVSARSVSPTSSMKGLVVAALSPDAQYFRISAYADDAARFRVSGIGTFTVSAHEVRQSDATALLISAKTDSASQFRVSAFVDSGSVSAMQGSASNLRISAFSNDAGLFHVSAVGGTSSPLSADSSSVSAKQGDAANLRISAVQADAANLNISAKSADAGTLRVSAMMWDVEYSAGPNVVVSARSVTPTSAMKGIVVVTVSPDAAFNRCSAIGTQTVSAHEVKQSDAAALLVSAKTDSASQFRISAFSNDGGLMRVSAIGSTASPLSADSSSISAKQGDAAFLRISAIQGDGGLLRVSAIGITVSGMVTSPLSADSSSVSAKQENAANLRISATQADASLLRVSANILADTVGNLTAFRSLNLSASQAIKATAGALYGYYLWNSDTKYNYVKMYNTSGAINVGTDTPILTIAIPPSAAANVEFVHGINGFTTGIGVAALSAIADNATTAAAASAVGGNFLYS